MKTLYLSEQQSIVKKRDEYLLITYPDKRKTEIPLIHISQVVVSGDVTLTTPALHALLERGIDISFLSLYGHFRGKLQPPIAKNAAIRSAQFRVHADQQQALQVAQACVRGKLANMRTMLLRANRQIQSDEITTAAQDIQKMITQVEQTATVGALLGVEGNGSAAYFRVFGKMLRGTFTFTHRRRRPPTDPVNAMLSLGYTLLGHQVASAIQVVGLDPYMGFLHTDRPGKPSMVLDLMEEWRQPIVDRSIITLVSKKVVQQSNIKPVENGYYLDNFGKHKAVESVVTRLSNMITYKNFRHSFSSLVLQQARNVARFISGEIEIYSPFIYGW